MEQFILECLVLSIEAALTSQSQKLSVVEKLRIKIEVAKQLVRLEMETGILPEKTYLTWAEKLQEISMMTNGWINYLQAKGSK